MTTAAQNKPSNLNGFRALVFFSHLILSVAFVVGGYLLGNEVAFDLPYLIAAVALATYMVKHFFGVGVGDSLFLSADDIRTKRSARFNR